MADQQEYYKAILGPKNQDYYLEQFSRLDDAGKPVASWHWPAFFVTFYWLLYRKMWLPALGYFFLPSAYFIILGVIAAVAGSLGGIIVGLGYIAYFAAIFVVIPMYANALYHRHCKIKINEVKAAGKDEQHQLGQLSGKGGTSSVVMFIVLIFGLVATLGILAAIAVPAYSQYMARASTTMAAQLGNNAAQKVGSFYEQRQQLPISLSEAGYSEPMPNAIREIAMNAQNGIITVTMDQGPVKGKSLMMVPSLVDGKVQWKCVSETIQDQMLPTQCRKQQ